MTINDERSQVQNGSKGDRVYAPDILPRLQSMPFSWRSSPRFGSEHRRCAIR
jgi:hypothetical protein